ncbi:MAG: sigma-54-dependent Fis family transcriptional regulator [Gammaproteobacteria bacterium]|nr:sigma-54-dependent Fis family transcriptional regulator [Gammaproteobacteria bacterium]
MARPLALVVDDEPDIRELLALTLQRMDVETRTAADVSSAKAQLRSREFQLCLTDMRLPDGDGLDLVAWMQAQGLRTPVAVITAHGNVETAVRALKSGAFDFISKPLDLANLRKLVGNALRLSEPAAAPATTERVRLLGESAPVQKLREMITRVARSQAPVHITGESGTGKELVARMIHELGARAAGPFVPVNCGAIPGELMESEFFGHRKGSFTGAVGDKPGLFQSAEGGTLFLDEIAELPLPMQVKLLRVIQEKSVRPIGQTQEVPVDVRILSATHKDLRALVAAGQFREDLFYRIDVIELRVPPLRERGGDILLLARHLLERQARELGLPVPVLGAEAAAKLVAHAFPGNVRELENIVERAVALCAGGTIGGDDIELRGGSLPPADEGNALGERLDSVQRDAIQKALEANRWNKTAAARQLGLTLRALRYRMEKLGME